MADSATLHTSEACTRSVITGAGTTTLSDCGEAAGQCHYETWEISYNGGQTWQYLGDVLVCTNAA